MGNIIIISLNLIYSIILNFIYLTRKHLISDETKIFSIMLGTNLVGLFIELICSILGNFVNPDFILCKVFTRLYLIYLLLFLTLMTIYICITCFKDKANLISISKYILYSIFTISLIINLGLPIETKTGFAVGKAIDMVYVSSIIHFLICVLLIIIYFRKAEFKKFVPFFSFMVFAVLVSLVQKAYPEFTLITSVEFLVIFIMYFTIENPDVKMINELSKATIISEDTNNSKTRFINVITNDVNDSLDIAEKIYNNLKNDNNNNPKISNDIENLKILIDNSRNKVKQTIDVSDMDSKYLRVVNTKYNVKALFESIYLQLKTKVNNNIDFRLNLEENMPTELYGDPIKIKQILNTIIYNSIKYTSSGFIELRVSSITKYDICRLIITVEDSGCGMDIMKINDIMSDHSELNEADLKEKDNINLNLKLARKMINLIGGSLVIDSLIGKGTSIKITIDQKIFEDEKSQDEIKLETYSNEIKNRKKCAVISLNKDEYKLINKVLKKDMDVDYYDVTLDCLNKLRNNLVYDYIFIDENMDKIDARSFALKCREINNYKENLIVITKNNDLNNKKELIDLRCNVLNLPLAKDSIKKIINY
jgi:signal transduction histidine kinase